ncbi:hypothetical protein AAMO2058_001087000 [Amorphochlora amoebiformis]
MSVRGLLAASQALNLALVAIIAYLCVGGTRENISLGVMRGAVKPMTSVMPSMRSPMMGVSRMVRPGVPTFDILPGVETIERDVTCEAVPKKRHSKAKKRHRKNLWKKKAFKQADKALMIARKIRNQGDEE